jgi:hypothetical protein
MNESPAQVISPSSVCESDWVFHSFSPVGGKCHMSQASWAFGKGFTCRFRTSSDRFMPLLSLGEASC